MLSNLLNDFEILHCTHLCLIFGCILLLSSGVCLLLDSCKIKKFFGMNFFTHGVNLFILLCRRNSFRTPAFHGLNFSCDPLPQAMILTSIVISFAFSILMLCILVMIKNKKYD